MPVVEPPWVVKTAPILLRPPVIELIGSDTKVD
jgi:hypothetical protein